MHCPARCSPSCVHTSKAALPLTPMPSQPTPAMAMSVELSLQLLPSTLTRWGTKGPSVCSALRGGASMLPAFC